MSKVENIKKNKIIYEGLVVKNYKEMCNLLDEPIKDGNSKIAQIKEWDRYFRYKKDGYKFIIEEVYDKPLQKNDLRSDGNNSIYVKLIELLLMHELKDKPGFTCNYTRTRLCYNLGLVNENYLRNNRNSARKTIEGEISNWQVENFFNRVNSKLKDVIFSALNSMKRRCLITYTEQYVIVMDVPESPDSQKYVQSYKTATKEETQLILSAQSTVLEENGWTKVPFNKIRVFYGLVNKYLQEHYGWDGVYREYEIIYNRDSMNYGIKNTTAEIVELVQNSKSELNSVFLEAINNHARSVYEKDQKRLEKSKEGWVEGEKIDEAEGFRYPHCYEYDQKILADIFVKLL